MITTHQPTLEQSEAIAAAGGASSLMISAGAGCAKTTTLQMMAPQIRGPSLALAFNKAIARELGPRLPENFTTKTLNGLGYGAWTRAQPQVAKWTLDERKLGKLVTEVARSAKIQLLSSQWDGVRQWVSAAMLEGISPWDEGSPLVMDIIENWLAIAPEALGEAELEMGRELAREVLIQSIKLARAGTISFEDQIYCPTILGGRWAQFPTVFIDESQDLSPMNHRMLELSLRAGGRLVAVGDQRQAIYAWRGADSKSMETMRRLAPAWQDLPLMLTFRCPKRVVVRQQAHAPGYRAWEGNPEGEVRVLASWGCQTVRELVSEAQGAPLAILCRNMAPLMSLAFKLLRSGIGCQVAGRDIGRSLVTLAKKLMPDDSTSAVACAEAITRWAEHESALVRANHQDHKLESIGDRAEALQAVLVSSGAKTSGDLQAMLSQLFAKDSGQVLLSTIHRAKGLEWPIVMVLDPWRIPSKWAIRSEDPTQLEQEANLRYVAETRTRNVLVLGDLAQWEIS